MKQILSSNFLSEQASHACQEKKHVANLKTTQLLRNLILLLEGSFGCNNQVATTTTHTTFETQNKDNQGEFCEFDYAP